ncbi:MAG: tyrosine-type recombinase/integrase [Phycisphaerales bacterium JB054]
MGNVSVTKRPNRPHYYAWIDGKYVSTGQTDQRVAMQVASRMATIGVDAYRRGKRTLHESLQDLIDAHLRYLSESGGRSPEHIRKKRTQLERPLKGGAVRTLKDVKKQTFEPWLDSLTCGPKTRNEYQTAWNVFLDWLVYEDKLAENPLRGRIRRARVVPHDRVNRRALTVQELAALVAVAGPRELVYLTAATTGARFGELKQLRWSDVHESGPEPYIALRASTTKNRKARTQSITAELAELLASARSRAKTPEVFRGMPSHHTLNKDLELAGIAKQTDEGVACFHSLRHTFTTIIARQTKDVRLAQRMADHADIKTTQGYLHTERSEHAAAMQSFPKLRATRRATVVVRTSSVECDGELARPDECGVQVPAAVALSSPECERVVRCVVMEPGGIEPPGYVSFFP